MRFDSGDTLGLGLELGLAPTLALALTRCDSTLGRCDGCLRPAGRSTPLLLTTYYLLLTTYDLRLTTYDLLLTTCCSRPAGRSTPLLLTTYYLLLTTYDLRLTTCCLKGRREGRRPYRLPLTYYLPPTVGTTHYRLLQALPTTPYCRCYPLPPTVGVTH